MRIHIKPFNAPIEIHIAKVSNIAIHMGHPKVTPKIAISIPANPIIEPTLRSNSPAIINKQAPTAIIMNCADTIDQFITPCELNIPLSEAKNIKIINTAIVPIIPPSSGRIRELRNADISLTRSSEMFTFTPDISLTSSVFYKKGVVPPLRKLRPL